MTPFDGRLRVLKSDKYLQLVEAAQIDYLVKVGILLSLIRSGTSFVNVAQLVKFSRPVPIFSRVRVETRMIDADARCAYFSHGMYLAGSKAAEVLVKMKFKQGRMTVAPSTFLLTDFTEMPVQVRKWEHALEVL